MNVIVIRGIEMPIAVQGVTLPDANGDFNVYINTKCSDEQRRQVADHEIKHITLDHFYNDDPVIVNELEAG